MTFRLRFGPALLAILVAVALGLPERAPAQQLEVSGQAGLLVPASDLLTGSGISGGGSSLGTGVPLSATAGVRFPSGLGLELSGLQAYGVDVEGNSLETQEADFSALTAHFTYGLSVPGLSRVLTPFVGAGLGVREVDFGTFPPDATAVDASSSFTGVGLVGAMLGTEGRIGARLEARGYFSSFEELGQSNSQQDFALLGGLTLRFP